MWAALRILGYAIGLIGLGVVGHAVFSDLPAPTRDVVVPITPEGDGARE